MQPTYVRERRSRDSLHLFGAVSVAFVLTVSACGSDNPVTAAGGAGGGGEGGATHASGGTGGKRSNGDAGAAGSTLTAGAAGTAGVDSEAGAGGVVGEGGVAGRSGSGGAPVQPSACEPGGTLFSAGNYSDSSGNELWLRQGAKARTLALLASGAANADKLPQLFVVDRVCVASTALIARDPSSAFRLDFSLEGNELSVCMSAPMASVEAALLLPAADIAHLGDTGCLGKPFHVFATEAVAR
jgi:hypothetical protein